MRPEHSHTHTHCPSCGSHRVRKSRKQGVWERFLSSVSLHRPYRCESCDLRFWGGFHSETKPTAQLQAHEGPVEKVIR